MHRFENWRTALQLAPSQHAVAQIVADYLKCLREEDIRQLPPDCERAIREPVDIQRAAVTLRQAELSFSGAPQMADYIQEVARTFAAASMRLSQLHTRESPVVRRGE
jgi:hypothetical protein